MTEIIMHPLVGDFAENKDRARKIKDDIIVPALEKGEVVILDFQDVDSATQSFIHALISDIIRRYGAEVLDFVLFRNCNENVRKVVEIVVEYMQESDI